MAQDSVTDVGTLEEVHRLEEEVTIALAAVTSLEEELARAHTRREEVAQDLARVTDPKARAALAPIEDELAALEAERAALAGYLKSIGPGRMRPSWR